LLQGQVAAGLIDSGDAKLSHNRNLVTRALGKEESSGGSTRRGSAAGGASFGSEPHALQDGDVIEVGLEKFEFSLK
jgi:hypothetical protein